MAGLSKAKSGKGKPIVYFSVSEVARVLGVSSSTVRTWESLGIVTPKRTKSGYRQFSQEQVEHLKEVQRVKSSKGITSRALVHVLKDLGEAPVSQIGAERASISTQLTRLRESRGLTLSEAAQMAGISLSFLSGIERDRLSASIATLQKLAQIYGTNVLALFGEQGAASKLIRPTERRRLSTENGVVIESLAVNQSIMEPHLFHVAPGASSGGSYTHEGEEFLYLIKGQFEIWLDDEEHYRLSTGDSLYFSSRQAHRWTNPGADEAILLWLNTPATF